MLRGEPDTVIPWRPRVLRWCIASPAFPSQDRYPTGSQATSSGTDRQKLFPTCQVRVVRFLKRIPPLSPHPLSPHFLLNCQLPIAVGTPGHTREDLRTRSRTFPNLYDTLPGTNMEVENHLFFDVFSGKWSSKGPFSTSMLVPGSVIYSIILHGYQQGSASDPL